MTVVQSNNAHAHFAVDVAAAICETPRSELACGRLPRVDTTRTGGTSGSVCVYICAGFVNMAVRCADAAPRLVLLTAVPRNSMPAMPAPPGVTDLAQSRGETWAIQSAMLVKTTTIVKLAGLCVSPTVPVRTGVED
jgi:hypothetical protein